MLRKKKIPRQAKQKHEGFEKGKGLEVQAIESQECQEMGSGEVRELRTSKATGILYPILVRLRIIEELTYRKSYYQSPISKTLLWLKQKK